MVIYYKYYIWVGTMISDWRKYGKELVERVEKLIVEEMRRRKLDTVYDLHFVDTMIPIVLSRSEIEKKPLEEVVKKVVDTYDVHGIGRVKVDYMELVKKHREVSREKDRLKFV